MCDHDDTVPPVHKHDWQVAWWCGCGEAQLRSDTSYAYEDGRWSFDIRLAGDATEEVVRHELAHVLQRWRYGSEVEAHGQEFEKCISALKGASE